MTSTSRTTDRQALEARLALHLTGALTARAERLPPDVAERLRFARTQALARARRMHATGVHAPLGPTAGDASLLGAFLPWLQRAASVLPLLLLVAGLALIGDWSQRELVLAAADIDTQLLVDALPPNAYADPGFVEYLRSAPPLQ